MVAILSIQGLYNNFVLNQYFQYSVQNYQWWHQEHVGTHINTDIYLDYLNNSNNLTSTKFLLTITIFFITTVMWSVFEDINIDLFDEMSVLCRKQQCGLLITMTSGYSYQCSAANFWTVLLKKEKWMSQIAKIMFMIWIRWKGCYKTMAAIVHMKIFYALKVCV